tara:strand:+ start:983 stop:1657 length:675 start_codon:yes stop_codon:yes gene_type:complete
MNNLIKKKIEYLLSIPENFSKDDVINPVEEWFNHFHKEALWGKSKPKFQFENYVCFHKNYQFKAFSKSYAVYLDDDKFFLVAVQKPVTMLMQTDKMEIEIITEILSDQHQPKEVNQKINTFAKTRLKSNSVDERIFLDAVVNYDPKKSKTYEVNEKLFKKEGNLLDEVASSLNKLSPFDKLKKEEQESTADIAIKLRELASLRDDGIITDQEFKKMKEGILFKK